MSRNVLVTGFEPFGGDPVNPSWEIAKSLEGKNIEGCCVKSLEVPVCNKRAVDVIQSAIDEYKPDVVITLGLAWGRCAITVEKVAINIRDYSIPDNYGDMPQDLPIDPEGPVAYFSTLPIRSIVKELRDNGIPSFVSYTAGSYLCNQIMYGTLHYCAKKGLPIKTGHIHVPYMASQIIAKAEKIPSWPLGFIQHAIELSIKAAISHDKDVELIIGEFY